MTLTIGMVCFGVLIGYITYRTLARATDHASISDLAAVIGAVGGGGVTAIVRPGTDLFGWYAIGLLAGFVAYAILFRKLNGKEAFAAVMGRPASRATGKGDPYAPRNPRRD